MVRNVNGTNNSGGTITHQIEVNIYYKGHVERMRIDVCNLGKTKIILGVPWLVAHNPGINWETGEVKITRCLLLCGRTKLKEEKRKKKGKRVVTLKEEKIEEMVPRKFLKQKKVFGKVELKRILTRKIWDHTIDLKETFKLRKGFTLYLKTKEKKSRISQKIN